MQSFINLIADDIKLRLLGGLGQLVGSCIAEAGIACKLVSRGCPDYFVPIANPEFLYARNGMDADGLYEAMKAMF